MLLFFFNDTATTEIYTLSLHDALPICKSAVDPIEIRVAVELEDLLGDRAGIFRIQIDRAGLERGENDAGVAQTGSMLDRCLALHRLAQHFAEDIGLGKALGADAQRVGLRRQREDEREEREGEPH